MSQPTLGLLRALFILVVFTVVHYFTDATVLKGIVSDGTASIVAMLAGAVEHAYATQSTALFGAVKIKNV